MKIFGLMAGAAHPPSAQTPEMQDTLRIAVVVGAGGEATCPYDHGKI